MWLTVKQACALTGRTRFTISERVQAGDFKTLEPPHQGKRMLIDRASIIDYYLPGLHPKKKS